MREHRPVLWVSAAILAVVIVAPGAWGHHTVFLFRADRFEIDGNALGAPDGVPDLVDEFDDGTLSPTFSQAYGTVSESGGWLVLTNPGSHYASPVGAPVDVSIAASSVSTWVTGGAGDFTSTSWWDPILPPLGQSYHFTLFPVTTIGGYHQIMGIGIAETDDGLHVEQHRADLNQSTGVYQNTIIDYVAISPGDVTGAIGLRLEFDDGTSTVTTAYSLNGGATWNSPFTSYLLSTMGSGTAQFLLSADPEQGSGPGGTTTTSTSVPGTTTTSTTLVPGACSAVGCRRGVTPGKSRLALTDKGTDTSDALAWKLRKGDATMIAELGDPRSSTSYELCIGDATGTTLLQAVVPPGGDCGGKPCWKMTGRGFKYKDPAKTHGGIRIIVVAAGDAGKTKVVVKGRGENLEMPDLPLAQSQLPLTVRLQASTGVCWANVFPAGGITRNIDIQLLGSGN